MKEKINAIQNYLNIYRSIVNMGHVLNKIGIYVENSNDSDNEEETLFYHIRQIYWDLDVYTFEILDISSDTDAAETFTNMITLYAHGDNSITAEAILNAIEA